MNSLCRPQILKILGLSCLCLAAASSAQNSRQIKIARTEITYCDADPDLMQAVVRIHIEFYNLGRQPTILSRTLGPTELVLVTDLTGREIYHPDYHFLEAHQLTPRPTPDQKLFEIISAGNRTEREFDVSIPISKTTAHHVRGSVSPGHYRLTAKRSLWPIYGDEARARKMRKDWMHYGRLDFTPVTVRRVQIELAPPQQAVPCAK